MKKSSIRTAVAFLCCLSGVGVIRHYTVEAKPEEPKASYVATVTDDITVETIEIEEEQVALADTVEDATDENAGNEAAKMTPSGTYNSPMIKPTSTKAPTLGMPSSNNFLEVLDFLKKYGKAKVDLTKAALGYGNKVYGIKVKTEAELRELAVNRIAEHGEHLANRIDTVITIVEGIDEIRDNIKEDVDAVKEDINTVKEDIDTVKEDINSVKEEVDQVVSNVKERHEKIETRVDAVVSHVEERHDAVEGHVDTVVSNVKKRHEKIHNTIGGIVNE